MVKKVILITGCSSGFGYLTARSLSSKGNTIYAGVRHEKDLKIFDNEGIHPVLLDVTWSQEKINGVIDSVIKKEGRLDILVNNAGFGYLGITGSFGIDELKEQYETNLFGAFKVIKSVLPSMRRDKCGLIINISSVAGLFTSAFYGVYSSSKFALEALTSSLRVEESINGIKVVSVNPGSHVTKFWENVKFPAEAEPLNNKIAATIQGTLARFREDPKNVVRTIEKIINSKNPRKNYLVGLNAYATYFVQLLTPQFVVDFIAGNVIANLNKKA